MLPCWESLSLGLRHYDRQWFCHPALREISKPWIGSMGVGRVRETGCSGTIPSSWTCEQRATSGSFEHVAISGFEHVYLVTNMTSG